MLNRLFIAIGVLVILAIAAAFVVPRFIQWGDYRARLETMAAEAFGTEVAIAGDIQLTLLPQPKLEFTNVRIGPKAAPIVEVAKVEAEVSLVDFMRDQYRVTSLKLQQPVVNLAIAADGTLASGLVLAPGAAQANVSIANAEVVDGSIRLADARSGQTYVAEAINGDLRLDALEGPFTFQGKAALSAAPYVVRVTTGKIDASGTTMLSTFLSADDGSFTLQSNGTLTGGATPKYTADLNYRQPPPKPKAGEAVDAGRGDLVLEGKLEATPSRVLLSSYTLTPDDNRSATRITGAAELTIGKQVAFNAVGSAGVLALPPRDATKEQGDPPWELVRILSEIPLPPIPPVAGKIGLDVAEINLRGVSLRNVRLDAHTDARSWAIDAFKGTLPGDTSVGLTGILSIADGRSVFAGGLKLDSRRLDLLSQIWRKPPPGNPLFNTPGSLIASIGLSSEAITFNAGSLVVDGINHGFDGKITFGPLPDLQLNVHLTTLGEEESAAMAALLPDAASGGSFGATFKSAEFQISASKAVLFGQEGSDLYAAGTWAGGVLQFTRLAAGDLGGASFDVKATAFGTFFKPELSGSGHIKISDGAPIVAEVLGQIGTPAGVEQFLERSLPADLDFQLLPPKQEGDQNLVVKGRLGTADASLDARLSAGLVNVLTAPVNAQLSLSSGSPALMTSQLGLGDTPVLDDGTPLQLLVAVDGSPKSNYQVRASLTGGSDHIGFDGNVSPGDFSKISGDGQLDLALADPGPLVAMLGAEGIHLPPISGRAQVTFTGLDTFGLAGIEAPGISGTLSFRRLDGQGTFGGSLKLASIDVNSFLPLLVGAAGSLPSAGVWSDGPIDIGPAPRASEGRIDVTADAVTANGAPFATSATFGFDWDARGVHLRNAMATVGGGTITTDVSVCCSSATLPAKQVQGRVALNAVPLDSIAPTAIAAGLDGTIEAAAEFDGTGATLAEAMSVMTGSGTYTIKGLSAAHFDPAMFARAAALQGIVDTEPEALSATVSDALAAGPFNAPSVSGVFTIAGGVLRSPNLAIDGEGGHIFGGASVNLGDLFISGRYTMTPFQASDPASSLDPNSAEVAAVVTGPLWAPIASYDVSSLVDGMKIKASEIELARLEKLQADDEARQKAAAEERARIAAEEAARKAAEEAALKAAAEKAAKEEADRRASEEAAAAGASSSSSQAPMDLGL